jgi:hypothetical protein
VAWFRRALQASRGAEQVPLGAGDVKEHGDTPIGLRTRLRQELDPGVDHALTRGVEVVDAQEEPDPAGRY